MATVLVTGAGGYLASWIVSHFLTQGHTVHGTVRKFGDSAKLAHLDALAEAHPGRLILFEADLLQAGSFDLAMQDCTVVVHAASPYFLGHSAHPQEELIAPAVDGTANVLASVNRTPAVTRVVVTSSIIALYGNAFDAAASPGCMIGPDDINHTSTIATNPYAVSKTRAEQTAWDMQRRQSRWELVTVHPGVIFGPALSRRTDATSVDILFSFLKGAYRSGVPRVWLGVVDVRDAALAHVRAALCEAASGRYIAVAESLTLLQIGRLLAQAHPAFARQLPSWQVPKWLAWLGAPLAGLTREFVKNNVGYPIFFDHRKSREELGICYRAPADTLAEHVQQVLDDGLLPR